MPARGRARPPEPLADAPLYARYTARIMVLPADIVEAVVARAPYQPGWDQIRAYLDAGGDVNDVTANGKTILILFLTTNDMEEEEHSQFVRFLIAAPKTPGARESGLDAPDVCASRPRGTGRFHSQIYSEPARRRRLEPDLVLAAAPVPPLGSSPGTESE